MRQKYRTFEARMRFGGGDAGEQWDLLVQMCVELANFPSTCFFEEALTSCDDLIPVSDLKCRFFFVYVPNRIYTV